MNTTLKLMATGAAAAGVLELLPACSLKPVPLPYDISAPVSNSEQGTIERSFNKVKKYWTAQDVGAKTTQLVILQNNQDISCPNSATPVIHGDKISTIRYCETTDEVVVGQAGINWVNYLVDKTKLQPATGRKQFWEIIMAHEYGHSIQRAQGLPAPRVDEDPVTVTQPAELQADCLAGAAIVGTDEDAFIIRTKFYTQIAPDPNELTHGSAFVREESFTNGALDGAVACKVPGVNLPPKYK